ncbi:MAG: hypothetical protein HY554_00025 [Elusimicrobia bacterium]|nr:hypothetical protein [Elusimicrobiota bacterium]
MRWILGAVVAGILSGAAPPAKADSFGEIAAEIGDKLGAIARGRQESTPPIPPQASGIYDLDPSRAVVRPEPIDGRPDGFGCLTPMIRVEADLSSVLIYQGGQQHSSVRFVEIGRGWQCSKNASHAHPLWTCTSTFVKKGSRELVRERCWKNAFIFGHCNKAQETVSLELRGGELFYGFAYSGRTAACVYLKRPDSAEIKP